MFHIFEQVYFGNESFFSYSRLSSFSDWYTFSHLTLSPNVSLKSPPRYEVETQ